MDNHWNRNKISLVIFFILIWGIMLVKTILVSAYEPESFFTPFYSIMLNDTWQSHFNFDLFLFTVAFAGWVIYREKSILGGIVIGILSILFGGVFAFLYSLICAIRTKGNLYLFFNGKTNQEI
tara:strand:+ start:304 stop:672 length:369 start_codon:yes stop_codon:yes gene_type:complete